MDTEDSYLRLRRSCYLKSKESINGPINTTEVQRLSLYSRAEQQMRSSIGQIM